MTRVRVKGIKRYRSKGRWYVYHRETGQRIDAEFGTAAFFNELAILERQVKREEALPGTLGGLLIAYRASRGYLDLASSTRAGYARMMNLLMPIHDMPLAEVTPQFVAGLRDRVAEKHGRRQANYVMAVISVACEHGRERGIVRENLVKGIKRVRRDRQAPRANRPWTALERRVVLERVPNQLRVPVALAMFTGLRKGDVLRLPKSAIREGRIWRRTAKTGHEMSICTQIWQASFPPRRRMTRSQSQRRQTGRLGRRAALIRPSSKRSAASKGKGRSSLGSLSMDCGIRSARCSWKLALTSKQCRVGSARRRWRWRSIIPRLPTRRIGWQA